MAGYAGIVIVIATAMATAMRVKPGDSDSENEIRSWNLIGIGIRLGETTRDNDMTIPLALAHQSRWKDGKMDNELLSLRWRREGGREGVKLNRNPINYYNNIGNNGSVASLDRWQELPPLLRPILLFFFFFFF